MGIDSGRYDRNSMITVWEARRKCHTRPVMMAFQGFCEQALLLPSGAFDLTFVSILCPSLESVSATLILVTKTTEIECCGTLMIQIDRLA